MQTSLAKLLKFIEFFMKSNIYQSAAPEKSPFSEDLVALHLMIDAVVHESSMDTKKVEQADAARARLVKASSKGCFQTALTIYPLGAFLCDTLIKNVAQIRTDLALTLELQAASDFAQNMRTITRDNIMKEKDGDWDVTFQGQGKFIDMVAKYVHFQQNASKDAKASCADALQHVEVRIDQLRSSLLEAASMKIDKKFPNFVKVIADVATGKNDEAVTNALQMLGEIMQYQCLSKVPLLKLLGKDLSTGLEQQIGSIVRVARLLQGAVAKLHTFAGGTFSEAMLLDDKMVDLYTCLTDAGVMKQLDDTLSEWRSCISKVQALIEKSVASFLSQTTSTFHGFVIKIMESEIDVDSVLQTGIVGSIDADDKDRYNLNGFQFVGSIVYLKEYAVNHVVIFFICRVGGSCLTVKSKHPLKP